MIDWDSEPTPPSYRVCRAGLAMVALGLALLGFSAAVDVFELMAVLARLPFPLPRLNGGPVWLWAVDAPITWLTLTGSYLLWAGWADPEWRRRAGLLVVLNVIDAVQWTAAHNEVLGLRLGPVGHPWLRFQVGMAFNWIELALGASLAARLARRLGEEQADDTENKVRALAAAGGVLWLIAFVHLTNWYRGWPLVDRIGPRVAEEWLLLTFGGAVLTLMTALNVVVLCIQARRRCALAQATAQPEERGLDLLKSRSETWEDEPWK